MNVYDSLFMDKILNNIGYNSVDSYDQADVIILNTCHIREKATEKVFSELGRVKQAMIAQKKEKIWVVVAGCVAQAEGQEIKRRAPIVDAVVGPQSIHTLPEVLTKLRRKEVTETMRLNFDPIEKFDFIGTKGVSDNPVSAFLSIQEGCDKFCTYCVVPYTRGQEYSRPVPEIMREAIALVNSGMKEITLLGQNVNGYVGKLEDRNVSLGELLLMLKDIDGLERIRYTTSHPSDMHDTLYEAHEYHDKIMPFLHLPVQSGSDKILRSMNRKHTANDYLKIIKKLKDNCPTIKFSSDFIVGFPGETQSDFMDTMNLVEEVGYFQAYSFKYSKRPGTPGNDYPNQIEDEEKLRRLYLLQDLLRKQQLEANKSMEGQTVRVLFDKKKTDKVGGKTPYFQSVYMDDMSLYKQTVDLIVEEGLQSSLRCKIL